MDPAEFVAPLRSLRDALRLAGFTAARLRETTHLSEHMNGSKLRTAVGLLQLQEAGDEQLAALARMFRFGAPAARDELEALFPGLELEPLAALGLVELSCNTVTPCVRMTEFYGLFFVYDDEFGRRPDCVVGVSGSSRLSAAYTPRADVESVLDVGTGCGVHALL